MSASMNNNQSAVESSIPLPSTALTQSVNPNGAMISTLSPRSSHQAFLSQQVQSTVPLPSTALTQSVNPNGAMISTLSPRSSHQTFLSQQVQSTVPLPTATRSTINNSFEINFVQQSFQLSFDNNECHQNLNRERFSLDDNSIVSKIQLKRIQMIRELDEYSKHAGPDFKASLIQELIDASTKDSVLSTKQVKIYLEKHLRK